MTLMGRLPDKGVLVGLAFYEYINQRQGAVRCGNELMKIPELNEKLNFANPKRWNSGL